MNKPNFKVVKYNHFKMQVDKIGQQAVDQLQ